MATHVYVTGTGQSLMSHRAGACWGSHCVIHDPSDHHMRYWPTHWRPDRKIMERLCPHGIGHPDPDSLAYVNRRGEVDRGDHGCDGCCWRLSARYPWWRRWFRLLLGR